MALICHSNFLLALYKTEGAYLDCLFKIGVVVEGEIIRLHLHAAYNNSKTDRFSQLPPSLTGRRSMFQPCDIAVVKSGVFIDARATEESTRSAHFIL